MTLLARRQFTYSLLAVPALGVIAAQVFLIVSALRSALTSADGSMTMDHVVRVLADPMFQTAALNNVVIPVASVIVEAGVGLGMALWLTSLRRGRRFWRTIAIVPFAVPEIVYLLTMKLVFRQHGYLNSVLVAGGVTGNPVGWLDPGGTLTALVILLVDAWRVTPLVFLIVAAALEQLPAGVLDAARVDGAGRWSLIRRIEVPLVLPALGVAVALRAIDAFRIFATPLVLVGVDGFPVLTSVAYHYKADLGDAAAANATALLLAGGLVTIAVLIGLVTAARRRPA